MTGRRSCPVCDSADIFTFLAIPQLPTVCNRLCATRASAVSGKRADAVLAFCRNCTHAFNQEYDPAALEYDGQYENRLSCSEVFRKYDGRLVEDLIGRYGLHQRTVVELGCGSGEFLQALCEKGGNRGFGFDPAHSEWEKRQHPDGITFLRESFDQAHPELAADFICSRQTLEHVSEPRRIVENLRRSAARRGVPVFCEVPNFAYTLRENCIWDVIYEHCGYFTRYSLACLFALSGFRVTEVSEAFGGQFLTLHALVYSGSEQRSHVPRSDLEAQVRVFAQQYRAMVERWRRRLTAFERDRRRVVVWGAGAKGAMFLNALRPERVEYVVDLNPKKHGKYVIGTGQRIVPPEFLVQYRPDAVVVMNPLYSHEIFERITNLGIETEFLYA